MRTPVSLVDDGAGAVDSLRREASIGVSEAVNDLVRSGLVADGRREPFVQRTHDLGAGMDVSNIAEVIETVDGPAAR